MYPAPIICDPYQYQPLILRWLKRTEDGEKYRVLPTLLIVLKHKPKFPVTTHYWELHANGDLLVKPDFIYNGPNVMSDSAFRMLGALIHDILCSKEARGAYSYWRKNWFYGKVLSCQISNSRKRNLHRFLYKIESWTEFTGLILFNWLIT